MSSSDASLLTNPRSFVGAKNVFAVTHPDPHSDVELRRVMPYA